MRDTDKEEPTNCLGTRKKRHTVVQKPKEPGAHKHSTHVLNDGSASRWQVSHQSVVVNSVEKRNASEVDGEVAPDSHGAIFLPQHLSKSNIK